MSLWPAISGCLVMACAVLAVDRAFLGGARANVALIVEIVVGALAYAATLFTFHRARITTLRGMLRTLHAQQADGTSPSSEKITSHPLAEAAGAL